MNKKDYQRPTMRVVKIQHSQMLCASGVTDVDSGDAGIGIGGGSSGQGRSRSFGDWNWDGEEE